MVNHKQLSLLLILSALLVSVAPQCPITSCDTCFTYGSSGICEECKDTFAASSDYSKCQGVTCPISDGPCRICSPYESLVSGTCEACAVGNCILCFESDKDKCEVCQTGYRETDTDGCEKCNVDNCADCDADVTKCQSCMMGYSAKDDTTCEITACSNGKMFNGKQCVCPMMTYFDTDSCKACSDNCKQCTSTQCNKCSHMFYPKDKQCLECMDNCYECSSATTCSECNPGFIFFDEKCQSLPVKAPGTVLFQKPDSGDNKAYLCQGSCMTCLSPSICEVCYAHFYNDNGHCKSCSSECKHCLQEDPNKCTACQKGKYLQNYVCSNCPDNCKTCHQKNYCETCKMGYFLEDGSCTQCDVTYCTECSAANKCTSCKLGFTPVDGTHCRECLKECSKCDATDITQCTDCFDGFYLENQSCKKCQDNCKTCSSETVCTNCNEGYNLVSDNCVQNCQYPCLTCSSSNIASCNSCFEGYNQNSNKCESDESCTDCKACPSDHVLDGTSCTACTTTDAECSSCFVGDLSKCASCLYGFYLDSDKNSCQACPSECLDCTSATHCTECQEGKFLGEMGEERGKCMDCSADYNCKSCDQISQNCQTCNPQYFLYGRKCITQNYIEFQLSADSQQLTLQEVTTKMNKFQTQFQAQLQIPDEDITFINITQSDGRTRSAYYLSENTLSTKEMIDKLLILLETLDELRFNFDFVELQHTVNCGISNCLRCNYLKNSVTCLKCAENYAPNEAKTDCKQICNVNNLDNCLCDPKFVNEGGFCKTCLADNCKLCSVGQTKKCDICENGYTRSSQGVCEPDCSNVQGCLCGPREVQVDSTTCATCTIDNCVLCSYNNPSKCDICQQSTALISDGAACQTCTTKFCKICKTPSTCSECLNGYKLQGQECKLDITCVAPQIFNGVDRCVCPLETYGPNCDPCPDNCAFCSTSACEDCYTGYYLLTNGKCSKCPANCDECDSADKCTKCGEQFTFNKQGKCVSKNSGRDVIIIDDQAFLCPDNCDQCNGPQSCTKCGPGYYINQGQCDLCSSECKECLMDDKNYCTKCYSGFKLNQGDCFKCQDNCKECQNAFFCTQCRRGLYSNEGTCQNCGNNCLQCVTSGCKQCETGYVPVKQACTPCNLGCSVCSSSNINQCLECSEGFFKNPVNLNCTACASVNQGCESCTSAGGSSIKCDSCSAGFDLASDDNLCYPSCEFPCYECQKNKPTKCTDCYKGYTYVSASNICTTSTDCNVLKSCTVCPKGFSLMDDKTCKQCQYPFNFCDSCPLNSPTECGGCQRGYYLTETSCDKCPVSCTSCKNPNFCTSCSQGFFAQKIDNAKTGQCLACDEEYKCKTCKDSETQCTSCISGYDLKGQKCLNRNHLTTTLVFTKTTFEEMTLVILTIIQTIVTRTGIHRSRITIFFFFFGSVGLQLQLDQTQETPISKLDTTVKEFGEEGNIGGVQLKSVQTEKVVGNCEVDNCKTCADGESTKCGQCNDKYNLVDSSCVGVCQVNNCNSCQADNIQKCKSCADGYLLTSSGMCEKECTVDKCLECESGDNAKCSKCENGYFLNNESKCQLESNLGLILGLSIPLGIIAILIIILSQRKLSSTSGQKQVPFESSDGIESNDL